MVLWRAAEVLNTSFSWAKEHVFVCVKNLTYELCAIDTLAA